jgi:hypothetical protein
MADHDTEADAPLDPAAERLRRKLVGLLLGSGLIMMLGLIAVFAAIVYKTGLLGAGDTAREAGPAGQVAPAPPAEATIDIPPGTRLVGADLDGGAALLTLQTGDGATTLLLVDLATGSVLGRYALRHR